jgi:hypothetical protein
MNKANNIKDFKALFLSKVNDDIKNDDINLKLSKNKFISVLNDNDKFSLEVFFYKKTNFIEIETNGYYGNISIENYLKRNYSKYEYKDICGGNAKFICEYYFKKVYEHQYSTLIYDLDSPISDIVQLWINNFTNYFNPFFLDCIIPEKLNAIVNGDRIETTGMNLTYKNRVLKSLFVGYQGGLSKKQLFELADKYEEYLKQEKLPYLSDFLEVKENVFIKEFAI